MRWYSLCTCQAWKGIGRKYVTSTSEHLLWGKTLFLLLCAEFWEICNCDLDLQLHVFFLMKYWCWKVIRLIGTPISKRIAAFFKLFYSGTPGPWSATAGHDQNCQCSWGQFASVDNFVHDLRWLNHRPGAPEKSDLKMLHFFWKRVYMSVRRQAPPFRKLKVRL